MLNNLCFIFHKMLFISFSSPLPQTIFTVFINHKLKFKYQPASLKVTFFIQYNCFVFSLDLIFHVVSSALNNISYCIMLHVYSFQKSVITRQSHPVTILICYITNTALKWCHLELLVVFYQYK